MFFEPWVCWALPVQQRWWTYLATRRQTSKVLPGINNHLCDSEPQPPSPTVNTHFLYVSNGCHFPLGGVSMTACCQTMPYSSPLLLTSNSHKEAHTGLYCFALFCALIWIRTLVLLASKYNNTLKNTVLWRSVGRKRLHMFTVVNASLQGWIGPQWMRTCVHTARQNVRRWEKWTGMGEDDIYLTLQHLAFCKSNRYLIKAQSNWLFERWMLNCLVVYLEIFI